MSQRKSLWDAPSWIISVEIFLSGVLSEALMERVYQLACRIGYHADRYAGLTFEGNERHTCPCGSLSY